MCMPRSISTLFALFFVINRFFQLMGSVFSFVSNDLKQKIEILKELLEENEENYATLKKMVDHELQNNIMQKNKYRNGSRILLKLHRGLGL